MKKAIAAAALAMALAPAGAAWAHGPSGSYEGTSDHVTQNNNVTCNRSTGTTGSSANVYVAQLSTGVYAGTNGVEACKDGNGVAGVGTIQGRAVVTGSYMAADGDRDNSVTQLQGWAKLSASGPQCGPDGGGDYAHQSGSSANCG